MFKDERTDKIMEILQKYTYTTVDFLVNELHYSPATIRRDLTYLEDMGLVKKSYGGVSINKKSKPLIIREHENIPQKMKICHEAVKLIENNSKIFIDGTTTAFFMHEFLDASSDITVVTSNLKLALEMGEKKIPCFVTGGKVYDMTTLAGTCASDTINKMNFDICFFSTGAISAEGYIAMGEWLIEHTRAAINRSKKSVCLCDSTKLNSSFLLNFASLNDIDCLISDVDFDENFKAKFPHTEFITAK